MSQPAVLVTGLSGLIGGIVQRQLAGKYRLTGLNRSAVPGVECVRADITDFDAIRPAFDGMDYVIHLAANANYDATWEQILDVNIAGTYNVFEAARQAGVKRVIYASSGAIVAGWEREQPYRALVEGDYAAAAQPWPMITHESPIRPRGLYGASKVWGEALARHVTDSSDLSILCLRIGHVTAQDQPNTPRLHSVWCSQRDIGNAIELSLTAPADLKFDILFVTSNNRWGYRDLAHTQAVLGFRPQDAAEDAQ